MSPPPIRATVNGVTRTAAEWAALVGISRNQICKRLRCGVPPELAVTLGRQPRRGKRPLFDLDTPTNEVKRSVAAMRMRWVARRCLDWQGANGERLDDDEIADVVALVQLSRQTRMSVLQRGGCVAHLCRAVVVRRALHGTASREMLSA